MNEHSVTAHFRNAEEDGQHPISLLTLGLPTVRRSTSLKLRVAIYARYSDPSQKKDSIDRQVFSCSRYLVEIGGSSYQLFADEGISGSHADRDALNKLFGAIRSGEINTIIIEDFDRLSREVYDAVDMFEELEKYGCTLHSAAHGRALSKEDAVQLAMQAEKDRKRRAVVVTAGKYQMASRGKVPVGAFFGYDATGMAGEPKTNATHAATILRIFELAAANVSTREVARTMDKEGRVGPNGKATWMFHVVRRIIHNPLYAGLLLYGRRKRVRDRASGKVKYIKRDASEVVTSDVPHLQIVSVDVWLAANKAVKARHKRRGKPYADGARCRLLPKNLTCDCPGVESQCFGNAGRSYPLLSCNEGRNNGSCKAATASVSTEVVERTTVRALREFLQTRIASPTFVAEYRASVEARNAERVEERARLQKLIGDNSGILDRLLFAQMSGQTDFDPKRIRRNIKELEAEVKMMQASYKEIETPLEVEAVQAGRLLTVDAALEMLERRLPFQANGKVDDDLVSLMGRLVPAIEVQRAGRPLGHGQLAISVSVSKLFGVDDSSAPNEIVHAPFRYRIQCTRKEQTSEQMIEADVSRRFALSDETWACIERDLSACQARDGGDVPLRRLVDLALLAMGMDVSLKQIPQEMGEWAKITRAFTRFVHSGGLDVVDRAVGRSHPAFPNGLPMDRFASAPRGVLALRSPPPAFVPAITDAEWQAISETMFAAYGKGSRGRPRVDMRNVLDQVLHKLRTGQPWHELPYSDKCRGTLWSAVVRLVGRGDWARAEGVMRERFPHLLEGLEMWRMEALVEKGQRSPCPAHDVHVDLDDEEWDRINHVLLRFNPRLRLVDSRGVVNGILWVTRNCRPWKDLPSHYGLARIARARSLTWRGNGTWDGVVAEIGTYYAETGADVRWIHATAPVKLDGRDRPDGEVVGWVVRTAGKAAQPSAADETSDAG